MKIRWLSFGLMGCGATMSWILHSLVHHRFRVDYAANPLLFWFAIVLNAVVIYLLIWNAREVARENQKAATAQKKAGIAPFPVGVNISITPSMRICVYGGSYILGLFLYFL